MRPTDTLTTVQALVKKLRNLAKTTTKQSKDFWLSFLQEAKDWIKLEKARLQQIADKWSQLRWAVTCAEKASYLLGTDFDEVGAQSIWENWEGFLLWESKQFDASLYTDLGYRGGPSYTGDLSQSVFFKSTKCIAKVLRLAVKKYFPKAKVSIKSTYNTLTIAATNVDSKKASEFVYGLAHRFNYDYGDCQYDYFNNNFYLSGDTFNY